MEEVNFIQGKKILVKAKIEPPKEDIPTKTTKILAWMMFSTGIFAIAGALYMWGDGPLFGAPAGTDVDLYYGDLIFAGPLSIIAAIGFWKAKRWGALLSLLASGVYVYGSVLVYVSVIQAGIYPLKLVIPPIFGLILSIGTIWWTWKNLCKFD